MKWNEMTTGKKILFVISLICGAAYFILLLLDIFNIWTGPESIRPAIFGAFWIFCGFLQKNKKLAIFDYVLGVVWLLLSLFYVFDIIVP
jgi:hypothetical protein